MERLRELASYGYAEIHIKIRWEMNFQTLEALPFGQNYLSNDKKSINALNL